MRIWPKGTGRYLAAQIGGIWLWFIFYFAWLLVVSVYVGGWGLSVGRLLLAATIFFNLCGLLLLRKLAHAGAAGHTQEERTKAVRAGEFYGEMAVVLTDEDAYLYGAASDWSRGAKAILLILIMIGIWFGYSGAGFALVIMGRGLELIAGAEAAGSTASGGLISRCWETSSALRIYVIAGALMTLHILASVFIRPLRDRTDRFVLGPYFRSAKEVNT